MPKEQYKEYIKDYDGGTLMEAEIDSKIDYSNLSEILKQQKDCIVKYSQKLLNVKRKHTFSEFEEELIKKGLNINSFKNNEKNNEIEINKELFDCLPGVKDASRVKDKKQKKVLRTITKEDISIENLKLS